MSNAPIGTTWGETDNNTDFLGLKSQESHKYTLAAKGITVTVNGNTYKDAIVVNLSGRSYDNIISGGESVYSSNYYYARGVGLVKQENVDPKSNISSSNVETKIPALKGKIDKTMVGIWTDHEPDRFVYTYKFNEDGTYQYFVGQQQMYDGDECFWRVDGGYLVAFCTSWKEIYRYELQKRNDPKTGKPTLVIQFRDKEYQDLRGGEREGGLVIPDMNTQHSIINLQGKV